MEDGTEPGATRWLSATELDAWKPFSGMLLVLLSALDAQLQRDAKLTLFGYLVMAGLSEAPERTLRVSPPTSINRLSAVNWPPMSAAEPDRSRLRWSVGPPSVHNDAPWPSSKTT